MDGVWETVSNAYTENWDAARLREVAGELFATVENGGAVFIAFDGELPVGFVSLGNALFGSRKQYIEMKLIQVSYPYRHFGIGKRLFTIIADEARKTGAKSLYISAHSSAESQAFYRAIGCIDATEPDKVISEDEPFDVQMEFVL